jgi:hypothetical protein
MINEFIAYLQGAGLTPGVELAFTSDPIDDYSDQLPAILVYPSGTSANESIADNFTVQPTTESITCVLGCSIANWETLRAELRAAAIGWVNPGTQDDAMELTTGEVVGIRGGVIWWSESYSIRSRINQES